MVYNEILSTLINEMAIDKFKFAWLDAAPLYKVNRKNGSIKILSKDDLIEYETLTRANSGTFVRDASGSGRVDYAIDSKGYESAVDYNDDIDEDSKEKEALARAKAKIYTDLEVDFAALLAGEDVDDLTVKNDWTGDYSAPYDHVQASIAEFISTVGFTPNCLVVPYAEYMILKNDASFLAKFPGAVAMTDNLIKQNIAGIFGLDKVVVSTARKKVNGSASFVLPTGSAYLCLAANDAEGLEVPAFARTLQWGDTPWQVDVYQEKQTTSNIYQANAFIKPVTFDADFILRMDTNTDS